MFKVGDIITGTNANRYGITNENALMVVTKTTNNNMWVYVFGDVWESDLESRYEVSNNETDFVATTIEEWKEKHPNAYFCDMPEDLDEDAAKEPTNVMNMTSNFTLDEEEMKRLTKEIRKLLEDYDYEVSDYGIREELRTWSCNKGWLIDLFKKHPNYNGNYQIVFDIDVERRFDKKAVKEFANWCYGNTSYPHCYNVSTVINEIKSNVLNEDDVSRIDYYLRDANLRPAVGQKTSRAIGKLCKYLGLNQYEDYERKFAIFADAVNPALIKRHTILSLHPIDYLTMSFGNSWASCHTIDKENRRGMPDNYHGCYSSGTLSYMLDGTSAVFYTLNAKYEGNEYHLEPKINRNMFHIGQDKIVQGRVYPKDNDGENSVYKQFREIVQKVIADCLGVPNLWINSKGTSKCESVIESFGTHYRDYENYSNCNVSYLKMEGKRKNEFEIEVGHDPICPNCGDSHCGEENILCEDCVDNRKECAGCGYRYDEDDLYWIDGEPYCYDCTAFCEYHGRREPSGDVYYYEGYGYACDDAELTKCENCDHYFDSDEGGVYTEDGREFCCDECAEEAGYIYFDGGWYHENEIRKCPECGQTVFSYEYNDVHDMCDECYEQKLEEEADDEDELEEAI